MKKILCVVMIACLMVGCVSLPALACSGRTQYYGDINGDRWINAIDANLLLNHINEIGFLSGCALEKADVDLSGRVDGADYGAVFRYMNGIIDPDSLVGRPRQCTGYCGYYGDVNGDRRINVADIDLILEHINGIASLSGCAWDRADVDQNGKVNAADYGAILRYVNGMLGSRVGTPMPCAG